MQGKETESLKTASAYSFAPNKLGYCGPQGSWQSFQKFVSEPTEKNSLAARKALLNFKALYAYLELIAEANGLNPFDPEAIEAYWLGNSLLENVSHSAMQKTILSFQKMGLPKAIAEKKALHLPKGMLPHHSMHVLYVNFITRKVPAIVQNLSNCLIQWGEVQETGPDGTRIKGIELFQESGELKIREKAKTVENPFGLDLQTRDIITVHWGNAVEKISSKSLKSLKEYTFRALKAIGNSSDLDE